MTPPPQGWLSKSEAQAFRLFRAGHAKAPRDWATRWQQAYAQLSPQEQQYATSGNNEADLCALKISRIWSLISRFGTPYPPFDFNSHMRLKSLTRQECTALGILPLDPAEQASIAAAQTAAVPSLNEHTQASVPSLDPDLRSQLTTALRGIATLSGNTLTMVDQNGTKPYSWQQIGSVISTPNPAAPQLQLLAFRDWAANPSRFSRHADDPAPLDEVEDLTRLLSRITPSPSAAGSPTLRHIIPASDADHLRTLLNTLTATGTYTPPQDNPAQLWLHSRTTNPHAFSIILICRNYHTPIRPDTLYQAISASSPGYIFTPTARFRILRTLASTSNRHGGTTISIEVEELPPPSSPITNRTVKATKEDCEAGNISDCPYHGDKAKKQSQNTPTDTSQAKDETWRTYNLPEVRNWKPLIIARKESVHKRGKLSAMLRRGISIKSDDGRELHLGKAALNHFYKKEPSVLQYRLQRIEMIKQVLQHPHEVWYDKNTQKRIYMGRYVVDSHKHETLVAFTYGNSNEIQTYFPPGNHHKLNGMRKGILEYSSHNQK